MNSDEATTKAAEAAAAAREGARSSCGCTEVAAYLDGELSVAESSSFELHIASCRACAVRHRPHIPVMPRATSSSRIASRARKILFLTVPSGKPVTSAISS